MEKNKKRKQKQIEIEYETKRNKITCPLYMELKNLARTDEDTWFKVKKGNEKWYEKIKRDNKTYYKLNEDQLIRDKTKSIGKHRIKDPMLVIDVTDKNKIYYKVQCNECGEIMQGRIYN